MEIKGFIRFLGAHGGKSNDENNTCIQIQNNVLIDAGNILNALGPDAVNIDKIFLTHSHMDHISDIPFLIDSVFSLRDTPIEIWGLEATIEAIKESIFNWKIWPDFSSIPLIGQEKSSIVFKTFEFNDIIELEEVILQPIEANHTVPCAGFIITQKKTNNAILLSGDTYKNELLWKIINENKNIKAAIIDTAFPSSNYQLGFDSKHYTPQALEEDMTQYLVRDDINICIYHTKPSYYEEVVRDLLNIKVVNLTVLHDQSKVYFQGNVNNIKPSMIAKKTVDKLHDKLHMLQDIGMSLSRQSNLNELIEELVLKTHSFVNVDGLSLYFVSEDSKYLEFRVIQTKSLDVDMRHTSKNISWGKIPLFHPDGSRRKDMVVCECVNNKNIIKIDDVYHCKNYNFTGTKKVDETNNYQSKSMLITPLVDHNGKVMGALQLINRLDDNGQIISFTDDDEYIIASLASQAAIVLSNKKLIYKLENLFSSFIHIIGNAIDETSEYTGGHVRKVSRLAYLLAKHINEDENGFYRNTHFTSDEFREIEIASWIHDIGKITVPEHKLDKATKLETTFDRIEFVKAKFEIHKRDLKIQLLEYQLSHSTINDDGIEHCIDFEEQYNKKIKSLDESLKFLEINNVGSEYMALDKVKHIIDLSLDSIQLGDKKEKIINSDEVMNLSIQAGTLTYTEKEIVKKHAYVGRELLQQLSFPDHLKDTVDIACNHHESLNGKGYPRGLTENNLTVKDRIMILSDIFEALTSADRPYKKAKNLSETFKILGYMVKSGHLDGNMIRFFVESGACKEFYQDNLLPEQIDEFKLDF